MRPFSTSIAAHISRGSFLGTTADYSVGTLLETRGRPFIGALEIAMADASAPKLRGNPKAGRHCFDARGHYASKC
jgi:hypothetical protein